MQSRPRLIARVTLRSGDFIHVTASRGKIEMRRWFPHADGSVRPSSQALEFNAIDLDGVLRALAAALQPERGAA